MSIKDDPPGTSANLTEEEISFLCSKVKELFLSFPNYLLLSPPIIVCGDIHGQYHDLLRIFNVGKYPPESNYLFLGDYVDRGANSIECVCLLFLYKILFPENFFLLRGNHECTYINSLYGFYDECLRHYDPNIWRMFSDAFSCLPIAASIGEKIFCIHGGISPDFKSFDQINEIPRPIEIPEAGLLTDLLWSDPNPSCDYWGENERGTSVCFGKRPAKEFLHQFNFQLITRAHQAIMNGYEFPFYPDQSTITVFSAPNYCYEFGNKGAFMHVSEELFCAFSVLEPMRWEGDKFVVPRPGSPPR